MKVQNNNKGKILLSLKSLLPLMLAASVFYTVLLICLIGWLLDVAEIEAQLAQQIIRIAGGIFIVLAPCLYLWKLLNSLSAYQLSIEQDKIKIKGKSGWKSLDTALPISSIERIDVINNTGKSLIYKGKPIEDAIDSKLIFFPKTDKPFKLELVTKAFDNQSLYEFLLFAKTKGIEINL